MAVGPLELVMRRLAKSLIVVPETPETFEPRLDILPESQRRLWPELDAVPPEFILYGGIALALQLGHRVLEDFDFFSCSGFDRVRLRSRFSGTWMRPTPKFECIASATIWKRLWTEVVW